MTNEQSLQWIRGGWRTSSPYCRKDSLGRVGIDVDGLYGFQCKDFSNAYAIAHGHPFTAGNAITLWTVAQNPYWQKVSTPNPGDVYVKDVVINGTNYGDTGIVDEVTSTGIYAYAQNQILDNITLTMGHPPSRVFYPFNRIKGYLRPSGGQDMLDLTGARIGAERVLGRRGAINGACDADLLKYHVGHDANAKIIEFENSKEGKLFQALQDARIAFYDTWKDRIAELSSRPTKAEYDKIMSAMKEDEANIADLKLKLEAEQAKKQQVQIEYKDAPISDQKGWEWFFGKIKSIFIRRKS